ncbi:MAG: 3-deoxy-D-manno-octulosonic acid transferase [Candidatus Aminicenantes bacterium]|nr:3-deoxy-D-manno-octulosonic acid transferase [Candidatus Aminicenantes bacterium]
MYALYSLLLFLALSVYAPVYFIRLKFGHKERLYLRERLGLGFPPVRPDGPAIWLHAVSVGEVLSLRRLVSEIKRKHPHWRIYFSTLTTTGFRIAKEKMTDADAIFLVPLDFGWIVRRFFSILRPRLFIVAESEFWPQLLRQAARTCSSVLLINGRISRRSFRRYRRLGILARRFLSPIDRFLVQTESDRRRLMRIGLPDERLEVAGNLKADIRLPPVSPGERDDLKRQIGLSLETKVIVAGSTHRGEEEKILKAFKEARAIRQGLDLVIAPRHPHRSPEVEKIASGMALKAIRRTQAGPNRPWDVLILDTIGELARFYALADLAFIGGSLVPHGGQNLLEPAHYGKPLLFGPHMENFAFLADLFVRGGAARIVKDRTALREELSITDEIALAERGLRAREILVSLQGATERTIRVIESFMEPTEDQKRERP